MLILSTAFGIGKHQDTCFFPRKDSCILTKEMETKQANIQLRSFQVMPNTMKEMKYLGCTGEEVAW